MTYAPLDDRFDDHPKFAELSAAEMGIIACAITYSNRNLSDGRIPRVWPGRRFGREGERLAKQMLQLGIWSVRADGDYEIDGFLEHNPSKSEVLEKRERRARAGREGGVRSGKTRSRAHFDEANASALASSKTGRVLEAPSEPTPLHYTEDSTQIPPNPPAGGPDVENSGLESGVIPVAARMTRLPPSERAQWGQFWLQKYTIAMVEELGRAWTPQAPVTAAEAHLESAIGAFCKDKTRIPDWVDRAAREFAKATRDEDPKFWSGHQPKGMIRWFNEGRPGYKPPRPTVVRAQAPPTQPPEPPMSTEQIAAAAAGLRATITMIGNGGARGSR